MRSGEAARRGGVSVDTLAHYERLGLLPVPVRDANGYRRYDAAAVDRVRLIQRALDMGFTLDELGRVLKLRDELRNLVADWDARLASLAAGRRADVRLTERRIELSGRRAVAAKSAPLHAAWRRGFV